MSAELNIMTSVNLGPLRKALEEAGAMRLVVDTPRRGDTKLIWNPDNDDEVAAVRRAWNDLVVSKHFLAFRVGERGRKGEQVREFDPEAEKLIIVPPIAGGM